MSPFCRSGAAISSSPVVAAAERRRRRPRRAQRVRLRLAAALRDRLGEVREQDGEPEPDRDHADEPELAVIPLREVLEEDHRRDHAAELDDEHHRVLAAAAADRASGTSRGRPRATRSRENMLGRAACHQRLTLFVEGEVELEDVDAGLAEEAERAAPRCSRWISCCDGRERQVADSGDATRLELARRRSRSPGRSPSPDGTTASTGIWWIVRPGLYGPSSFEDRRRVLLHELGERGVGRAEVRERRERGVVRRRGGRRPLVEVARAR